MSKEDFRDILSLKIEKDSDIYRNLIDAKMIYDESDLEYSSMNKYLLREIKGHVNTATSLHIFVVTTRCNMGCVYCQANNGFEIPHLVMNKEMSEKAVNIALQSPEQPLCFEFQGGEPLINFDIIKHIVEYTELHKQDHIISYTVVTNLT